MTDLAKKTVCILYGWGEGRRHGRRLRQELERLGYTICDSVNQADIIITHSGGMFLLPEKFTAKLLMFVGLPYWPNRHPAINLPKKIQFELNHLKNPRGAVGKTLYNALYITINPRHNYKVWQGWKRGKIPDSEQADIVAVRNKYDAFMHPEHSLDLVEEREWKALSLPGTHDDLWLDPKPYVEILNKFSTNI